MADHKKSPKSTKAASRNLSKPRASVKERGLVMGSEVGMSIPIGDTFAHLRFSFWHERISPSDSIADLKATAELIEEFNEEELDRRVRKMKRLVRQILNEDDDDDKRKGRRKK